MGATSMLGQWPVVQGSSPMQPVEPSLWQAGAAPALHDGRERRG